MSQAAASPRWGRPFGVGDRSGSRDSMRVSDQERDAVADQLASAYAAGRLDRAELEDRVERALTASTRAELAIVLQGLGPPPWLVARAALTWSERGWAFLVHAAGLFTSIVGPLVMLLWIGRRSAYVRGEAVEALNWQLSFLLLNLAIATATGFTFGLAALLWVPIVVVWPWLVLAASLAAALGSPLRPRRVLRLVR